MSWPDAPSDICVVFHGTLIHILSSPSVFSIAAARVCDSVLTWMKRWTVFATFLASFDLVMGCGGVRKSLVGICLLQGA